MDPPERGGAPLVRARTQSQHQNGVAEDTRLAAALQQHLFPSLDRDGLIAAQDYIDGIIPKLMAAAAIAKMRATGTTKSELAVIVGVSYPHMRNALRADLKRSKGGSNIFGLSGGPARRLRDWLLAPQLIMTPPAAPTPEPGPVAQGPAAGHQARGDPDEDTFNWKWLDARNQLADLYRQQGADPAFAISRATEEMQGAFNAGFRDLVRRASPDVMAEEGKGSRLTLIPFAQIELSTDSRYLVRNVLPREGLVVVWGPPKCGKSFWIFDLMMHVALSQDYRGQRVEQGSVVYIAAEGAFGFRARVAAWRQRHLGDQESEIPFYLVPTRLDLITEASELIQEIDRTLGELAPSAIVIDTLNRSLAGSENSDEDMGAYVEACDRIREAFQCAVVVVHHCGVDDRRPRGHTSLAGAADGMIKVGRAGGDRCLEVRVESLKDGPEGTEFHSRLEQVDVGVDESGETITSCVVIPADRPTAGTAKKGPRLTPNQQTMLTVLQEAGPHGLDVDEWNRQTRDTGFAGRRQQLYQDRVVLKRAGLVHKSGSRWYVTVR